MVHHLSVPFVQGVNAFIAKKNATVKYKSFDEALLLDNRDQEHGWLSLTLTVPSEEHLWTSTPHLVWV